MNSLKKTQDDTSSWEKRFDVLWTIGLPLIFISGPNLLTKLFTGNIWAPLVASSTGLILYVILFKLVHKFRNSTWRNEKMEILVIGSIIFWSVAVIKFIATNFLTDQNNEWGTIHSMVAIAVILIAISVRVMYSLQRDYYTLKDLLYKFDLLAFIIRSAFIVLCLSLVFSFWATWFIWFPVILAMGLCAGVYSISDSYYENSETCSVLPYLAVITGIISTVWQFWSDITYGISYAFTNSWNWVVKVSLLKIPLGSEDSTVFPLWAIAGVGIILSAFFLLYKNYLKDKRRQAEEYERVKETLENEKLNQARLEDERKRNDKIWEKEQERQDALEKKVREAETPSWIDIFDSKRRFSHEVLVKASLIDLVEISHTKQHLRFDNNFPNALNQLSIIAKDSFNDQILGKIVEQFAKFDQHFNPYKEYLGYESLNRELSRYPILTSLLEKSKEVKETPVAHV